MARTPVRARPQGLLQPGQPGQEWFGPAQSRTRQPFRFWYLPLLLALLLPLLLWAGLNIAVVVFSNRDLGAAADQPVPTATAAPDQALLDASITLVESAACLPSQSAIRAQPGLGGADWSARTSEADPHAYYVAAADPVTAHLLGVWQVEGGQVLRLQDGRCPGLPAGTPERLAEAAVLFSPHHLGSGQ